MNKITLAAQKYFSTLFYLLVYKRAANKLKDNSDNRQKFFKQIIAGSTNKRCMQIGVRIKKFAPHWTSVDLYDKSDYIDYNYDVTDLKFENEYFDIIVCNAVLEHVEDPITAINELYRTLKKSGIIWVEVPFNQPYHPSPNDFWRVTLEGIKIWMKDFNEISAGFFKINKSTIYNGVYFYGQK